MRGFLCDDIVIDTLISSLITNEVINKPFTSESYELLHNQCKTQFDSIKQPLDRLTQLMFWLTFEDKSLLTVVAPTNTAD